MEIGPSEFAVSDSLQPEIFLELDDAADRFVLDRAQYRRVDLAAAMLRTRIKQCLGAKEAADMIGAERRCR
ncbi:hypothetical protein GCM10009087_29410 [Sphingomonas oligophenolica]